jgi:hypothetical protein
MADDQILGCRNAQRHVLMRDTLHHRGEVGGVRINQVDCKRHDGGCQGLGLFTDRLVGLIKYVEQLRVGLKHVPIEQHGRVIGDFCDDGGGFFHHGFRCW